MLCEVYDLPGVEKLFRDVACHLDSLIEKWRSGRPFGHNRALYNSGLHATTIFLIKISAQKEKPDSASRDSTIFGPQSCAQTLDTLQSPAGPYT